MSKEGYRSLFNNVRDEPIRGESSVFYLYSDLAPQNIKAFDPTARIIVMLRNPVDLMYSLHSQLLFTRHECIRRFEQALEAEPHRIQGLQLPMNFPKNGLSYECLFYRKIVRFEEQIRRYVSVFGWKSLHIILFDDLKHRPHWVYRHVCQFLGVNDQFFPPFEVINPSRAVRSEAVANILRAPSRALTACARVGIPNRSLREALINGLTTCNNKIRPLPALAPHLRAQLNTEMAAENHRLEQFIGRDLSAWLSNGE